MLPPLIYIVGSEYFAYSQHRGGRRGGEAAREPLLESRLLLLFFFYVSARSICMTPPISMCDLAPASLALTFLVAGVSIQEKKGGGKGHLRNSRVPL